MNHEHSKMAADCIAHEAHMAGYSIQCAAVQYERPCVLFSPKIYMDGKEWCVLYGENLQDGVAGFGKSPQEAMNDFDINWLKKIRTHDNQ
jgi:hypothetical protein